MSDTFDHELDAFDSRERADNEPSNSFYQRKPQRKAYGSGLTVTESPIPAWKGEEDLWHEIQAENYGCREYQL